MQFIAKAWSCKRFRVTFQLKNKISTCNKFYNFWSNCHNASVLILANYLWILRRLRKNYPRIFEIPVELGKMSSVKVFLVSVSENYVWFRLKIKKIIIFIKAIFTTIFFFSKYKTGIKLLFSVSKRIQIKTYCHDLTFCNIKVHSKLHFHVDLLIYTTNALQ